MGKHPVGTAAAKRAFLDAFAQAGTCLGASKLSGVDDRNHYVWLQKSEQYRQEFAIAKERAAQVLEAEARRRAADGYDDPIFYNGVQVGHVRRYSDLLMIFLLKAAKPDIYRDYHSVKVSGSMSTQATITVVHEFRDHTGQVIDTAPIPPALPPADPSDES
jgi:hypothetical protein